MSGREVKSKLFSYKKIQLGQFTACQFTLFELKSFASVILYWSYGSGWQGRYHSHAFQVVSFRLYGSYRERVRRENGDIAVCDRAERRVRYFSREHCHELGESRWEVDSTRLGTEASSRLQVS